MKLTYDDVRLVPGFFEGRSRGEIDISTNVGGLKLDLPIISAPMKSVYSSALARTMYLNGAIATTHRFMDTVTATCEQFIFNNSKLDGIQAVGLNDWERIELLHSSGSNKFVLDVANGAQIACVEFTKRFKETYPNSWLMVGNFAHADQVETFISKAGRSSLVDAWRLNVGPGAACETQINTGVGYPALATLLSFKEKNLSLPLVSDGGLRTAGDVSKALAAGAHAVMLGSMLAGFEQEVPKDIVTGNYYNYKGSASQDSYNEQGKNQSYITYEGASFHKPIKPGSVQSVLKHIAGGLRSGMSYVGAMNLSQFHEKAKFVQVSQAAHYEGTPHGKDK